MLVSRSCPGPVRPERCEGCQTGQLGKQQPVMLGFMPQHPPPPLKLGRGRAKKKWLQAKHPTEREAGWLRGPLGGWAPHQRAARRGVQDKQAQQPCRVNCRRELVRRGGWGKCSSGSSGREMEGNGGE